MDTARFALLAVPLVWCGACDDTDAPDDAAAARDAGRDGSSGTPQAPQLRTPVDGALLSDGRTALCWSPLAGELDGVRYRVYVDGRELAGGKVVQEGFAGPCTEPLTFTTGRNYRWYVRAYLTAEPELLSEPSERFEFSVARDADETVAFAEDFEEPAPWGTSGDAASGGWTWGTPNETRDGEALSQPAQCARGASCFYTGHNPGRDPTRGDVDGGEVVLESPSFDVAAGAGIIVGLSRFFYTGDLDGGGGSLRTELLSPDESAPDGYRITVLDALHSRDTAFLNAWHAVAFALCSPELGAGHRLRIVASDLGDGVVEAAIDDVMVEVIDSAASCERGAGAVCDPNIESACDDGLLCCQQGAVDTGLHRCTAPARALDPERDDESPGGPYSGPLGCPLADLSVVIDTESIAIEEVDFAADSCAVHEGCVGAPGRRRLLRFGMRTRNIGASDIVLGVPTNHPERYRFDQCHEHYHFEGFARYRLLDGDEATVASGDKIAQCLWDSGSFAFAAEPQGQYACYNQGLSVGFEDEYDTSLDCQWIDITGLPGGSYTIEVEVNAPAAGFAGPRLVERAYDNNAARAPVDVPPP